MSGTQRATTVNIIAELERISWRFEPAGDEELKVLCPVHEDQTPSCFINVKKGVFNCRTAGCAAQGDTISFLAYALKVERSTMIVELSKRYNLEQQKVINPQTVENFHEAIWQAGPLLQQLYDRGVTDEMIRKARLGFFGGRITIPVYDQFANVINIRRYLPGAPGDQKMRNTKGYGGIALYQVDQLFKYDTVWVCGGEMKALVAAAFLNPLKVGAIAATAGEGNWEPKWNAFFANKVVYVCMDIDAPGKIAARNLARTLRPLAKEVRVVQLPLDASKHPKGDINDWVHAGAGVEDFKKVLADTPVFQPEEQAVPSADKATTVHTTLAKTTHPSMINKRLAFEAVISAKDTTPFLVPKRIGVLCDRAQPSCGQCPIYGTPQDPDSGYTYATVPATSLQLLAMVDSNSLHQSDNIRVALGVPKCKVAQFVPKEYYRVVDTRMVPQLTIGGESSNNVVQPGLIVDHDVELNTPYAFSGVVHPHPKNQQAVLLVDEAAETADNLSTFAPNGKELDSLVGFQPEDWTVAGVQRKLDDIYQDFESNVTNIFGRREMHLLLDLTYHSVLVLKVDNRLTTGWVNSLLLGDSSQGKSEMVTRLMQHYELGERVVLKTATVAGLIGGLQQLGTRWFVSWGIIPTHDRRLVVLDEVKGADVEVLGKMTDMRSSGIAEIPKIERRRAHARTRLVFMSNPRSARRMAQYNFGVEAIQELMGGLEDVRRFDIVALVTIGQVSNDIINRASELRGKTPHKYNAEISRRLVLYAWTRTPEQVQFEPEALTTLYTETVKLCDKFTEAMPLVDRGTTRYKLARLATALAARTFSTAEDREVLLVRKCHVEYIARHIDASYSAPHFGYLDYSKAQVDANLVVDPQTVRAMMLASKHPKDLVRQFLYRDEITLSDLQDWCEVDQDEARKFLSFLIRKHCLYRQRQTYSKTADFITLLKQMEAGKFPKEQERSDKEEF